MTPPGAVSWMTGERQMWLLPQKAIWWPSQSLLMVSDLHLAKAEHFRSKGLAVPPTVDFQTLGVLTSLLNELRPSQLVILGDLFHSAPNRAWQEFSAWLFDEFDNGLKDAILVRGNHDRAHDATYEDMGLVVVDSWTNHGVVLTHEPDDEIPKGTAIHLCGHIHPAVRLRGAGRQSVVVPCFVQTSTGCEAGFRLTLPAFGAFTGTHLIEPKRGVEAYLISESSVMGPVRATPHAGFSRRGRR